MPAGRGVALVREPSPRLADGIVTHIERQPVDVDLAREQHAAYCAAVSGAGWRLEYVPPAPEHPDSVFVEDTVIVFDDFAIMCRPGAPTRRGELAGTAAVVETLGLRLASIDDPGTLDGGDVLQVGSTVYVGRGGRTNDTGIRQLVALLAPLGRTVVAVELRDVLHLKSAATALPDGTIVGLPELIDRPPFPTWREVDEEAGCHVVPLGDNVVLMASSAPRTADRLNNLGLAVVSVDIGEFEKLEGCVTCLSVLVPTTG